jgi:hypothetical protein
MIVVVDNETKVLIYIIAGSDLVLAYTLLCSVVSHHSASLVDKREGLDGQTELVPGCKG